jgi:hypothetical protein
MCREKFGAESRRIGGELRSLVAPLWAHFFAVLHREEFELNAGEQASAGFEAAVKSSSRRD